MARGQDTKLPAPYLRSVRFADLEEHMPQGFPFDLPWLTPEFELEFDQPVIILMGENGAEKSTLLEALASLAGFPTSGGRAWASGRPKDEGADALAIRLRASWLPRMKKGWFLKAINFSENSGKPHPTIFPCPTVRGFRK